MPVFGNKFTTKKTQARKWPSLSNLNLDSSDKRNELDSGPIKMTLNGQNMIFENGQWILDDGSKSGRGGDSSLIKKENDRLRAENNLLQLKLDTLIDLMAQTEADRQVLENENEQLKTRLKK
ncbi:DgyrCDS206 [Dimorphilus gyrociliatus]|uniref:DgyrCDS206 n=1 Tax=Dimorphilus gyrociliatus TaxID=2664684 RepID=A0A7I8V6N7_9ANNE|nr:DgyrCDS206 [Dimorphilus gyrociliatus]